MYRKKSRTIINEFRDNKIASPPNQKSKKKEETKTDEFGDEQSLEQLQHMKNITAFILAGGFSSRMGTNKALLKLNGKTLIQRTVQLLEKIFTEVVISSNEPGLFNFTGKKIIKDIFPNKGPLSGIHSCLKNSNKEINFIISTDMPFVSEELIRYIINYKSDTEIIIPEAEGKVQQLCGLYSKKIIPVIEFILNESSKENSNTKGSVFELLSRVEAIRTDVTNELFYHNKLFLNINSQNDFEIAKIISNNLTS